MMDIKSLIFSQIKEQFLKSNLEVDELNFIIDIEKNVARMAGYLKDVLIINEILSKKELSIIQKLFFKKIEKIFLKDNENSIIDKVYVYIKFESELYYIYIYHDGLEIPKEINL